jgi:replicative DNA helicase
MGMIVIRYLQLLAPARRKDNRQQEVYDISRDLKGLAKDLNVPVIVLSQLNREVEKRDRKMPQLSDLRDGGSIEADADVVLFIYRGDLYATREEDKFTQLLVAKQRNGPTGEVHLRFMKEYARFEALAPAHHHHAVA